MSKLKRIIICGGRDFSDWRFLKRTMDTLVRIEWMFVLVHGDARGADRLAASYGKAIELIIEAYPANWDMYGKKAGFIRNQEMLDSGIDGVVAFPGGRGTANMVNIATQAGVPVWDLRHGEG